MSAAVASHVASLEAWARAAAYKEHVIAEFMDCADPFLVGVVADSGFVVVTQETPAGAKRKKVKIPDACGFLEVEYENTFEMMRNPGARFV